MTTEEKIVASIYSEPVITKHICQHHWVSDGTKTVHPITIWPENVTIQMDSDRNYFNKAIKRVVENHKDLFRTGYYCKNDGSCPNTIRFEYTAEAQENLRNKI